MSIRANILAFLVIALSISGSMLAPNRYRGLPQTVIADVKALERRCLNALGMPRWNAETLVRKVDLSPDKIPDYVIDSSAMRCETAHHSMLDRPADGVVGQELIVWVSVTKQHWRRVMHRTGVSHWRIADDRTLDIELASSACPDADDDCRRHYIFKGNRLSAL